MVCRSALVAVTVSLCLVASAEAEAPDEAGEQQQAAKPDPFSLRLNGAFSIWGLNQRNFFLGKDVPLNEGDYVVQNVRLRLQAGNSKLGGVLRADAAQGWWGVDNDPNVASDVTHDEAGTPATTTRYNPYSLFRNKDTNYPIHFDNAFIYFRLPWAPLRIEAGRQYFTLGNQLVLDQDLDALVLRSELDGPFNFSLFWAKMSEGQGSFKAPTGALMNDDDQFADAWLAAFDLAYKIGTTHTIGVFGAFYQDGVDQGQYPSAYLPQGLGYFGARFQPQVSDLIVVGATVDGDVKVGKGMEYHLEFDFLAGEDDIANASHAGGLLDKNDGDIQGMNVYGALTQKFGESLPMDLGVVFGMGSGDDDPASGKGNVNRIQTQGLFALTNVWEDSVMPDIGGISPQGLGSPASRGYRELENTTAIQLKYGLKPADPLRLEASYTYLKATQDVHGWDANGDPTPEKASDLGMEFDLNLKLAIYQELRFLVLFGYFIPGDASAYLINGNLDNKEDAWEIKQVLLYKF